MRGRLDSQHEIDAGTAGKPFHLYGDCSIIKQTTINQWATPAPIKCACIETIATARLNRAYSTLIKRNSILVNITCRMVYSGEIQVGQVLYQQTHNVKKTRNYYVETSFWRNNNVFTTFCVCRDVSQWQINKSDENRTKLLVTSSRHTLIIVTLAVSTHFCFFKLDRNASETHKFSTRNGMAFMITRLCTCDI